MRLPGWRAECVLLTLVFVLNFITGDAKASDQFGLFFDAGGEVCCLPDTVPFPLSTRLYLILKDCSSVGGVGGWEGAFSLPEGCFLSAADLGDGAINAAISPEYIVGLPSPLPADSAIVLASFTLFFTQPGEVLFHAPANGSIDGVLGPVYLDGGDYVSLVEMNYEYGSPFHAVASAGMDLCPQSFEENEEDALSTPELDLIEDVTEIDAVFSYGEVSTSSPLTKSQVGDGVYESVMLQASDVGIVGTIVSANKQCYGGRYNRIVGAVELVVEVDETLFGPSYDRISIWCEGVDIPGCIFNYGARSFPDVDDYSPGVRVIAYCWYRDGVFWSRSTFLQVAGIEKSVGSADIVREAAREMAIPAQLKASDFVAVIDELDSNQRTAQVVSVMKSEKSVTERQIHIPDENFWNAVRMHGGSVGRVACLFVESEDGYYLLSGVKSVFFIEDTGIFRANGLKVQLHELFRVD